MSEKNESQNLNKRDIKNHNGYDEEDLKGKFNDELEGQWSNIQADYRKRYPEITDTDVNYRMGEFDHLTHQIAKRTNRSSEAVADEIKNWKNS